MRQSALDRFWKKVRRGPACWIWTAASAGDYGLFSFECKTVRAHRWIYAQLKGDPTGQIVRHGCDTPRCVNPDHLSLGTQKDNARDRVKRGRWSQVIPRGEQHGNAKLTDKQVEGLRRLALSESFSQPLLAKSYGVSQSFVSMVKNNKARTP